MLQDKVISIYCVIDDLLKEMGHREHSRFSDSQVLTTAIVSALYFRGNQTLALLYMRSHFFQDTINKSGFTKRLHRLKELLLFLFLSIGRCKLLKGEQYRGYNASKREYFYGVKIQLITTTDAIPVEMSLVEGREHDSQILQRMHHDLLLESILYGDSGYTDYQIEDLFNETELVDLQICRKSNAKRKDKSYTAFIKESMRKIIETSISQITSLMPRHINAATTNGFILKLILFVMAFQIKHII